MPTYGKTMSRITRRTLPNPNKSWRKRSPETVMSNQNHSINMKLAKASAAKLANVKGPRHSTSIQVEMAFHQVSTADALELSPVKS